jgi:hypothetical protein
MPSQRYHWNLPLDSHRLTDAPDYSVTRSCSDCTNSNRLEDAADNLHPLQPRQKSLDVSKRNQKHKGNANAREQRVIDVRERKVWNHGYDSAEQVRQAHDQRRDPRARQCRLDKMEFKVHHKLHIVSFAPRIVDMDSP